MSLDLWQDPRVPFQFQFETGLLLRCDWDVGIPFQMKHGNRPSFRVEVGEKWHFLGCGGKLTVPLEWGQLSQEASGVS